MVTLCLCVFWLVVNASMWRTADRRARRLGRAGLALRLLFAAYFAPLILYLFVPFTHFVLGHETYFQPPWVATAAYLWHPSVLMMTLLAWVAWKGFRRLRRGRSATVPVVESLPPNTSDTVPADAAPVPRLLSRRDALGLAASVLPPLATCGLTAAAIAQRGEFRVRPLTVYVPSLPADLDGLTIAHVTDLHAGNFLPAEAVARVADAVNQLRADLVVFTGDLIDRGLLDRLPIGLDLINRLDRRHGFAMIEGNHDLFADAAVFEQTMRDLKLPFLLDEDVVYDVPSRRRPGKTVAVQFLGISWGALEQVESAFGDPRTLRTYTPESTVAAVRKVAALRRPGAFPILLAHHPHAFDTAAAVGLPLTLSGHTHGGQIMLTRNIGAGPLRFRYWNGVHERDGCQLVISNGIGSWFPLRVNAPAEVLHITLMQGTGAVT